MTIVSTSYDCDTFKDTLRSFASWCLFAGKIEQVLLCGPDYNGTEDKGIIVNVFNLFSTPLHTMKTFSNNMLILNIFFALKTQREACSVRHGKKLYSFLFIVRS